MSVGHAVPEPDCRLAATLRAPMLRGFILGHRFFADRRPWRRLSGDPQRVDFSQRRRGTRRTGEICRADFAAGDLERASAQGRKSSRRDRCEPGRGVRLYGVHCAICHGSATGKPSAIAKGEYPRAAVGEQGRRSIRRLDVLESQTWNSSDRKPAWKDELDDSPDLGLGPLPQAEPQVPPTAGGRMADPSRTDRGVPGRCGAAAESR